MSVWKRLKNLWELSKYEMPTDSFYKGFIEATEKSMNPPHKLAQIIKRTTPAKEFLKE